MHINFTAAKKKLATLWFILAGIIILVMILMSFNKIKAFLDVAWSWLFPNILPSLSLILTVFLIDIQQKNEEKKVDRFYFRLAFLISTFYLLAILGILLSAGFGFNLKEAMESSNFYLGPLQGIVGASLGLFFYKKEE